MTKGLVSIIVPTYERTSLLEETLNSLMAQTYRPIEIWVIDDGSEGSENEHLCSKFEEVEYIRIPNSGGPAKPRNTGIQKANGEYIAFVDDDDLWETDKIEKQLQAFATNENIGLVHSCCRVMDQDGKLTDEYIGRPGDPSVKSGDVSSRMMGSWTLMTSTVIAKASVLKDVGFFNEQMPPMGEDMEYWCRCSFHTHFLYIDTPMVRYRKHSGTSVRWKHAQSDIPLFLMLALERLNDNGKATPESYKAAKRRIIRLQLRRLRPGLWKNLRRTFGWNPVWFVNFGNLKLFLIQLFSTD